MQTSTTTTGATTGIDIETIPDTVTETATLMATVQVIATIRDTQTTHLSCDRFFATSTKLFLIG